MTIPSSAACESTFAPPLAFARDVILAVGIPLSFAAVVVLIVCAAIPLPKK